MKKRRRLNKKKVIYLIENRYLSNYKLSKKLKISKERISTYKSRLRQKGIHMPKILSKRKYEIKLMEEYNEIKGIISIIY